MPGYPWRPKLCRRGHGILIGDGAPVPIFCRFGLIARRGNRQSHCGRGFGQLCRRQTATGGAVCMASIDSHCFHLLRQSRAGILDFASNPPARRGPGQQSFGRRLLPGTGTALRRRRCAPMRSKGLGSRSGRAGYDECKYGSRPACSVAVGNRKPPSGSQHGD